MKKALLLSIMALFAISVVTAQPKSKKPANGKVTTTATVDVNKTTTTPNQTALDPSLMQQDNTKKKADPTRKNVSAEGSKKIDTPTPKDEDMKNPASKKECNKAVNDDSKKACDIKNQKTQETQDAINSSSSKDAKNVNVNKNKNTKIGTQKGNHTRR